MELVWPSLERLTAYVDALKRGFSSDPCVRGEAASREQLGLIAKNAAGFVLSLVDREAKGEPITLADRRSCG